MLCKVAIGNWRGIIRSDPIDLGRSQGMRIPWTKGFFLALASPISSGFRYPSMASSLLSAAPDRADVSSLPTGEVTLLEQEERYLIVSKPPSVVCHHSEWTGSRSRQEIPMLQRVRSAIGRKVNLIHRLDRGCSGCLLMSYTDDPTATAELSEAMSATDTQKTYLALVRGEGILRGRDFCKEGWFKIDRPIKDERGVENAATTWFRFVAGQDNERGTLDRPRASLVLARPETGRWHQIRRHLNGLSHPIIGDSSHGSSTLNRKWRRDYGLLPERTCLHLAHIRMNATAACPKGIDISCPLAPDMLDMLDKFLPDLLEEAAPVLLQEGVLLKETSP